MGACNVAQQSELNGYPIYPNAGKEILLAVKTLLLSLLPSQHMHTVCMLMRIYAMHTKCAAARCALICIPLMHVGGEFTHTVQPTYKRCIISSLPTTSVFSIVGAALFASLVKLLTLSQ